ncbi:MAG: alpha-amylase [Anaerolineaceae bacterium]|nr:alpha-amylase [Anaerolineaceae bacterium]
MSVPQWVKDAVFYQIFPDRFANGDPSNDPPNVQPWGTLPTRRGFQGGDLRGITNSFDYLLDLGINAVYLNPIFMAASTHRYDTIDYLRIDSKLGNLDDFHKLIETAHRNNVRVILDGVFNHCARGFFAFNDVLENEADSPYLNWFHVKKFPLRAYDKGQATNYKAWWGIKSLPKLNTDYPPVRRYLLDVARYWIEQGADGWRLDVPNEIDDDQFWAEFRQTVLSANPEAYILGEIWDAIPRWVGENAFDGLMNYPVRTAIISYLSGKSTSDQFAEILQSLLAVYDLENVYAMYNLIGSHDVERILTIFDGDSRKVRLAFMIMFAFPGAPAIYYGDEIGLQGGTDPDCRRAFPWDSTQWDQGTHDWVKMLVSLRKSQPALRAGNFEALAVPGSPGCCAFARTLENQVVITAINASDGPTPLDLPLNGLPLADGQILHGLTNQDAVTIRDGKFRVALEPWQGNLWAS